VTGINASRLSEPLQAMLCWKYDPDQKEIKLLRVATVCAQVRAALPSKCMSECELGIVLFVCRCFSVCVCVSVSVRHCVC